MLGYMTFPREAGRMDGMFATVLAAEVLGGTLLVGLDGGGRTDWIRAMSVYLVPVVGTPRRKQYRCS